MVWVRGTPVQRVIAEFCILVPFWISVLTRAFGWVALLSNRGLINTWLQSIGFISEPLALVRNEFGVIVGMAHGVVLPTPAPISMKLATADVDKGRTYFTSVCAGCHSAGPEGGIKAGPNLWSVVGRDKASVAKMRYSDALLGWEGVWTYEDLNRYLFAPMNAGLAETKLS